MNDTKKQTTTAGLITLIIIACGTGAFGSPMLDQSQELSEGGSVVFNFSSSAQTFTPAVSGQLHHIDLNMGDNTYPDPSHPATISIRETVGDLEPSDTVLGTVNVSGFVLGWNSIDFQGESVSLNAGTRYAIVMENNDTNINVNPTDTWRVQWQDNHYLGGAHWARNRNDTGGWGPWYLPVADFGGTFSVTGDADEIDKVHKNCSNRMAYFWERI